MRIADELRRAGINTEIYLEVRKLGRQFTYADRKGIPLVVVAGPDEIQRGVVKLRRLRDGQEMAVETARAGESARALLDDR